MSRYIDADKLWNDRPQLFGGESLGFKAGFSECMFGFSKLIKEQISSPTADIVAVVRCKDCKHFRVWETGSPTCEHWTYVDDVSTDPDAFCSYGERREES